MDHVAILSKDSSSEGRQESWLNLIIIGKKSIESRWYVNRVAPWGKIVAGDTVYFKESGDKVKVKASVSKVIQFEKLDEIVCGQIFAKYGKQICLQDMSYYPYYTKKKYCILIFLKDVELIAKPFSINKKGFGCSSAWMCVGDIELVKIR